jgi:hypothetical protein
MTLGVFIFEFKDCYLAATTTTASSINDVTSMNVFLKKMRRTAKSRMRNNIIGQTC